MNALPGDGYNDATAKNTWQIITTLVRLSQVVQEQLQQQLQPLGFSLTDFRLMLLISWLKNASQKTLAVKMGLSQVVISTRLDRLEDQKLITRQAVARRRVAVHLTPTGEHMLAILVKAVERSAPIQALARLPRDDGDQVNQGLSLVISSMLNVSTLSLPDDRTLLDPDQDPIWVVREQMETTRLALDHVIAEDHYRITESVRRLSDELDTLLQAYMALRQRQGQNNQGW